MSEEYEGEESAGGGRAFRSKRDTKQQPKRRGPKQVVIPENPTPEEKQKLLSRAMFTAMWHLNRSMKTAAQIEQVLARKAFTEEYINTTVERLKELRLLNDPLYAEYYVASRSSSKGKRAIQFELSRKGVDKEDIESALEAVSDDDEHETAVRFAEKKARQMPASLDEAAKVRRLVGALARRGFSPSTAFTIARDAVQTASRVSQDDESTPYQVEM